jgi:hypothetical protein
MQVDQSQIRVEWANGNQQWCIVGGGLPQGACWDSFDSRDAAEREARELAQDIGCDFVE